MLEAFRLFGWDLVGIEILAIINDSLLGPLDLDLYAKWKEALDGAANSMISMAVWSQTIMTGAGLVFNRAAIENKFFLPWWR